MFMPFAWISYDNAGCEVQRTCVRQGTMRVERRDHRSRAATLQRVVLWITGATSPVRQVPPSIVRPDAGQRILKQLAVRGLLRRIRHGWIPSRLLRMRTELQRVDLTEPFHTVPGDRRDLAHLQCPSCLTKGVVRFENVIQGLDARRQFFCWACDHSWAVSDRRF